MALAQARLDDQLVAGQLGDRARRMVRAAGVAAIERLEFDLLQAACEQRAWRRPTSESGLSACPCMRRSRFHTVSPWRINMSWLMVYGRRGRC
jgi:hypothetical protein